MKPQTSKAQPSPPPRGRARERAVLDAVLRDVYDGHGRALVLHGESGAGKTGLLGHLADGVRKGRVVRVAGDPAQADSAPYEALRRLCAPLLDGLDRLPAAQRTALVEALDAVSERPERPEQPVASAVRTLFAGAATPNAPLICLVDDVQWLDEPSAAVLALAARGLDAEPVAMVFAVSTPASVLAPANVGFFFGLPVLRVQAPAAAPLLRIPTWRLTG